MSAAPATFNSGTVLQDAWNTVLGTFNKWVDHELGADVALEQEALRSAAEIDRDTSPVVDQTSPGFLQGAAGAFNVTTLALAGAAALLVILLLRR